MEPVEGLGLLPHFRPSRAAEGTKKPCFKGMDPQEISAKAGGGRSERTGETGLASRGWPCKGNPALGGNERGTDLNADPEKTQEVENVSNYGVGPGACGHEHRSSFPAVQCPEAVHNGVHGNGTA